MPRLKVEEIDQIVALSGIKTLAVNVIELGGGEVNDTYRVDFPDRQLVLRVARYEDQDTLLQEARALKLLDLEGVPKLIYFNPKKPIKNRMWILESCLPGINVARLNSEQFNSLGKLLAKVHKVKSPDLSPYLKTYFLDSAKSFGDEKYLRNHPDEHIRQFVNYTLDQYFKRWQPKLENVTPSLIHGDVTPSNMLASGADVSLIDWEFSKFKDPMSDFATSFYEDIEYNRGKWRVKITPEEKSELLDGYTSAGGILDEERMNMWMNIDKLGAAIFLYWRVHVTDRPAGKDEKAQYNLDLNNLINSLEKNLK